MKVLIVDDCSLTRDILAMSIEKIASIDFAENGKDALEHVSRAFEVGARYDLICLDINMPVMGGHEALRAIRTMEANAGMTKAVVFMITSSSSPDDMIEAITEGECDDYLTKPLMRKTFLELLSKHALIT